MAPVNGPDPQPVKPLQGSSGLNVGAQVPKVTRVHWRVFAIMGAVAVLGLGALYYGMKHRGEEAAAAKVGNTRPIAAATKRGAELADHLEEEAKKGALKPPPGVEVFCTVDPTTGQPFKFDPKSGAACTQWVPLLQIAQVSPQLPPSYARPVNSPVYGRPAAAANPVGFSPASPAASAGGGRVAAVDPAVARAREAMLAPTTVAKGAGGGFVPNGAGGGGGGTAAVPAERTAQAAIERAEARLAAFTQRSGEPAGDGGGQTDKERFIASAQKHAEEDYLPAVRVDALSPYEIRAGWIIPAVLEQRLNSDLPGDVRALVMSNVYDTATGVHLLIPQGARLVGKYDSRISYGQSNVQVVWDRLIYPDGSALNLDGMAGMESEGDSGLHDQVDRHYKRIFGFAAMTSMMAAGLAMTQQMTYNRGDGGYYGYPSSSDMAAQAAAREMSQVGMEITRKNLNVQPTLKIRAGERFAVKVNRDIVFDSAYVPRVRRR